MQYSIIWAVVVASVSAHGAQTEDWCGQRANSSIQCGYSGRAACEKAAGKGGMCFINKFDLPPGRTAPPEMIPPSSAPPQEPTLRPDR